MDAEELQLEEKCENLMNIVVESRKRFGKMCVDYDQKTSLMETKLLNFQLKTISSHHFKSKNTPSCVNVDDMNKDIENFASTVLERQKRLESLKKKIANAQSVVQQLKKDSLGRKIREPITTETLLTRAKSKLKK